MLWQRSNGVAFRVSFEMLVRDTHSKRALQHSHVTAALTDFVDGDDSQPPYFCRRDWLGGERTQIVSASTASARQHPTTKNILVNASSVIAGWAFPASNIHSQIVFEKQNSC